MPLFATSLSSTTAGQATTAFVANAEANVIIRLAPRWVLPAFGCLNYDNKVPGVSAPAVFLPFGFVGPNTPAGINCQVEVSYYAGGELTVKF